MSERTNVYNLPCRDAKPLSSPQWTMVREGLDSWIYGTNLFSHWNDEQWRDGYMGNKKSVEEWSRGWPFSIIILLSTLPLPISTWGTMGRPDLFIPHSSLLEIRSSRRPPVPIQLKRIQIQIHPPSTMCAIIHRYIIGQNQEPDMRLLERAR